ncbi:MAG: protein kinase [Gammaproteobacteria bacterium]|nr:protein kinase [Gammaproteobacteria bacterium]
MTGETDKTRDAFAEQLASLDKNLSSTNDDAGLLSEIQQGIGALLSSTEGSEAEIRGILQERYDSGDLRKETFHIVKSMLDRFVSERLPTSRDKEEFAITAPPSMRPQEIEDSFISTVVISEDVAAINDSGIRAQVGSVLRDRYLLQHQVSGGSMGVVYKALDRRLAEAGAEQSSVALKVLSPKLAEDGEALRALQQEAAKTRCLVHPHIVRFIDLDRDDDLYFLILEWLDGRTLAEILDSRDASAIDGNAAFRITHQVGDALDYAHRCGIVHADVKPGNIMILPNGDAKLFDFGVARVRQRHSESGFDPGVLGAMTPAYSSLQVLGGEEPTAADDVFSLACLLYRLVAGHRVFGPRNAAEASDEGMQPHRPQGLSDVQWHALKKALSYARVTRFASVRDFLDALGNKPEPIAKPGAGLTFEAPERFVAKGSGGSPGKWIAAFVVLLGLGGIASNQLGYLDPWLERLGLARDITEVAAPDPVAQEVVEYEAPEEIAENTLDEAAVGEDAAEEITAGIDEPGADDGPDPAARRAPLVDFSALPAPTATVTFSLAGPAAEPTRVILREDGGPVIVDFVRDGGVQAPLTLRLEEIGFSGNRSPWATGQYALANSGLLVFPAQQPRARMTFFPAGDALREPDQQSTLRLRLTDSAESRLAIVNVTIEDDDRRTFENQLPVNTIGFAASQVSVSEADPAVQVDVVRFNPDASSIVVGFSVEDHTATEGEDYFAPGSYSVSFGPGQRSTRLLIPLVQDNRAEGDEAFVVKLGVDPETQPMSVSPNIAVMIRDDEQ